MSQSTNMVDSLQENQSMADAETKTKRRAVGSFISRNMQSLGLIPVILAVGILGSLTSPYFFTATNLVNNVVAVSAALGLLVIAESIILIGGFFDLSMQSTVGFSAMLLAVLINPAGRDFGLWLSLLLTVAAVVAIGLFNGFMVSVLKVNAFIVTLAMLILIQGFTLGVSSGLTYTSLPGFIEALGTVSILGLPIQAIIFVIAFAAAAAFMRFTATGRALYAMGGSMEAARAAGIRTRRITIGLFIFGSIMAMFAGWLLLGQTAAATSSLGNGIIFTVFAAAVLGGIDLNGGRGNLVGAALGVLLLSMIQDILTLSRVPSFWINAAYGAIILGALLVGRASSLATRSRRKA